MTAPSSAPGVGEAVQFVSLALDFAYKHGLHEVGYDPVERIKAALSRPQAVGPTREDVAAAHWESERQGALDDGGIENDCGPWPPTAGHYGWVEDDAEAIREQRLDAADRVLALFASPPADQPAEREDGRPGVGWQTVPVEPTEEMLEVAKDNRLGQPDGTPPGMAIRQMYRAMLSASPSPEGGR